MANNNLRINLPPVLGQMLSKIKNRKPVMNIIAGIMLDDVRENFVKEGRPPWLPLASVTIKQRKRRRYWPGKILQRTGQLLVSIQSKATNDSAQVGTNKKYAAIHQFGGTINQGARSGLTLPNRYKIGSKKGKFKKGTTKGQGYEFSSRSIKIPARPFLQLSDQAMKNIEDKIKNYLLH